MNKLSIAFALTIAVALSACGKDEKTPYAASPDKPLIDIDTGGDRSREGQPSQPGDRPTNFCKKDASGNYPDGVSLAKGKADTYVWGRGGGCIHRNIKDAWAASLNQPLMVWDGVDESSADLLASPANVIRYYLVHYKVRSIISVRWDMDWYHSVQAGTPQDPQRILVNYKKVNGTSHIPYWEGNFILEKVNEEVTSFAMANQIDADRNNEDDAQGAVRDVYNKLRSGTPDRSQLP
jgi:hypothetical protein